MNLETEKILGTLEVLIEKSLEFRLHYNHYSSLIPFVWDVKEKGDFSLLNLGRDRKWITLTDIDVAVKSWQALERRGYLNPDDFPDDYEDRITPELADARAKIYETFADAIQKNLQNIQVLKFSKIPVYSFYIVLGQTTDNDWFCFSQTVARETKLQGEIKCSNLPDLTMQLSLGSNTAKLQYNFQQIINQLPPINIYGYYGGGYDYQFKHYLVQGIANSQEKALLIALQKAGMLDIAQFHEFDTEALSWMWDEKEIGDFYPKYHKINQFLNQNLTNLKMFRCSFWNLECIYIFGQTKAEDIAGIYIESEFDYNP
ncbi:hypothetical protein HCG51_19150 [Tolypothrix sp. PCC 7910]|uniref:nuclease A inhibitor family protein n=1 Tax=Tolypothrix sp. PCC 7910 TaxID=2099387 RepID=UPI00142790EA|nr:nuclease A inhibitor family protein [Tolypothrix sp. PCC 7910]QIR38606.1 hypothetical protein HCG51_19150 [Tolypothrix sp. PCC 7910]